MEVVYSPEARAEFRALPPAEQAALLTVVAKLEALGERLSYPHTSAIQGASARLRELRPRAGRSPWRAFYRRIRQRMVIGAIGPEAAVNPSGFRRSVGAAIERLEAFEAQGG